MGNNCLEKLYTKCDGETIHKPFSTKSKLSMFLYKLSKVLCNLFLLYAKLRTMEIY